MPAYQKKLGAATVVLFHDEMLSPENPLYDTQHQKVFIFDPIILDDWAISRLQFIADCLAEMPDIEVWVGNTVEVLNALNVKNIVTQNTPNLMLKSLVKEYEVLYASDLEPYSDFVASKIKPNDLKRFSKYWNVVGAEILKTSD